MQSEKARRGVATPPYATVRYCSSFHPPSRNSRQPRLHFSSPQILNPATGSVVSLGALTEADVEAETLAQKVYLSVMQARDELMRQKARARVLRAACCVFFGGECFSVALGCGAPECFV